MLRRELLRILTATPLTGWLKPWLPAFGGAAGEEPDAAAIYRRAFGWAEALSPKDRERLRKAATIALDDPGVDTLIQRAEPALKALRDAAAMTRCRWGTDAVTVEDLGKDRFDVLNVGVIHVACLSARRHAREGRGREALDDLFAGLTLAHRLGTGGVCFSRLLECGGEVAAFQTLGRILPGLDRAARDDLSRRLDALPPPEPASAAIGPESRFILGSLRSEIMKKGPMIAGDDWAEIGCNPEETAALQRLTGGDRARLLAHLEATAPAFAELARRLDLPRPGCRAALDEFAKAEESTHPVAAGLVEYAWGGRHMVDRMRAYRAMVRAGIVLVRDGEPAFRDVADPYGPGPFALERRGKGWLIRSALNDKEKPEVKLAVGEAN